MTPSPFCPLTLLPEDSQGLLSPVLLLRPSTHCPPHSPVLQVFPGNLSGLKGTSFRISITIPPPPTTSHLPPLPTLNPSSATRRRTTRLLPFRTPRAPTLVAPSVRRGATVPSPRAPVFTVTTSGMSGTPPHRTHRASPQKVRMWIPRCLLVARLLLPLTATLCVRRKSPRLPR